jgi:hypothetical protein
VHSMGNSSPCDPVRVERPPASGRRSPLLHLNPPPYQDGPEKGPFLLASRAIRKAPLPGIHSRSCRTVGTSERTPFVRTREVRVDPMHSGFVRTAPHTGKRRDPLSGVPCSLTLLSSDWTIGPGVGHSRSPVPSARFRSKRSRSVTCIGCRYPNPNIVLYLSVSWIREELILSAQPWFN